MSLESIINHILENAEKESEGILEEVKKKADAIIKEAKIESDKVFQELLTGEKALYEAQKNKLIVNARLEAKKDLLRTKQRLIDSIFEKAKENIRADRFRKEQVYADRVKEIPEDMNFYITRLRQEYEGEISKILFG